MEQTESNLNEAEQIFYHLLDDERMFNAAKFKKALQQQKARKVDDFNRALRKFISLSQHEERRNNEEETR